jgi:RimJ/RimL family protein N-acetyltransferase
VRPLEVRLAAASDSDDLMRWRNDTTTVDASVVTERVSREEHATWLKHTLEDPQRHLLVGVVDGVSVGTCRFDLDESGAMAEISVSLAPEHRGQGLSRPLVVASLAWLAERLGGPILIFARVRRGNAVSLKLFRGLGFVEIGGDDEFVEFELAPGVTPS